MKGNERKMSIKLNQLTNIVDKIMAKVKDKTDAIEKDIQQVSSQIDEIETKLNDTFISVSNGKKLIASAITDKGITTSNTDTFNTMANNIKSINNLSYIYYDVVIVGGGAGGIGAAYALKDSGLKVALIEKESTLGGTHVNSWVNVAAATPPPPFLEKIYKDFIKDGTSYYLDKDYQKISDTSSIIYTDTWLRGINRKINREVCIGFTPEPMAERYFSDLIENIDIYLLSELTEVKKNDSKVESIVINNKGSIKTIKGKVFIDSTGDDVLLDKAGLVLLKGEEDKNFFKEEYGFVENNAPDSTSNIVNAPTLVYKVVQGQEDLTNIVASYTNDALCYPLLNSIYVNTVSYLNVNGYDVIANGEEEAYNTLKTRTLQHWKTIKNGGSTRFTELDLPSKKYDTYAPKIGIRETYRAKCERMLNENNLYTTISSENIKLGENLDKIIACGNHTADIHGINNVNTTNINNSITAYGVPYGCLIPKGLNNVFVASRGAGFTHIAAATFRLTKDMMQLGWVAGWAVKIFIDENLDDVRDVEVENLQSVTDFTSTVKTIEKLINEESEKVYLFKEGDICSDITGGYDYEAYQGFDFTQNGIKSYITDIIDNNLTLSITSSTDKYGVIAIAMTNNTIDLSKYNKLCIEYDYIKTDEYKRVVVYCGDSMHYNATQTALLYKEGVLNLSNQIDEIDISNINSISKIGVQAQSLGVNASCTLKIKNIWLE